MNATVIVRWMARALSIVSIALLVQFAFSGGTPNAKEWVALAFFPVGVVIGMLVGWRHEMMGGAITLGSLAVFYMWMFVKDDRFPSGPYFLLFAAPGFLFLINGLLSACKPCAGSVSQNR